MRQEMILGFKTLRTGLSALVLAVLAGCGGADNVRSTEATQPSSVTEYHVGPGDLINVFVWNHPELSVTVPVRPDGLISTPLAENVLAAGKTPSQLARDMEEALKEFVRGPKVNIIVSGFTGGDQIRVIGQAAKPQAMPYRANMTLLDVMIQVGGLAQFAAGNRAKILRREGDKQIEIPVRLKDLINDGDIKANVPMRPGDVLVIPESRF